MNEEKRYWDSNVILAFLNNEQGRVNACQKILDEAQQGKVRIFTSAITITEVLMLKGKKQIKIKDREKVLEFFQRDYLTIINVDRWVAGNAEEFVWENNVKPKDAIHLASAIKAKLSILETYDSDLLKMQKKIGGHDLTIREPAPLENKPLLDRMEKTPDKI